MTLPRPVVLLCLVVFAMAGPVSAEAWLSTSTNPMTEIGTARPDDGVAAFGASESLDDGFGLAGSVRAKPRPADLKTASNVRYERAWLDRQPYSTGGEEWQCLAEALYFEARGESIKGQFAVAEVIMNRVASKRFPDTVCGVVNQGTGRKYQCQFSFTCDGNPETIAEPSAFRRVGKVAMLMLSGAPRALTNGATHYHTRAVVPSWADRLAQTTSIGDHLFYRRPRS
ncbi:cell wall hydrolase [Tropicimonas sp.]|uniref:cell wall hydrolase n=1 Tax=Tropicimonas sp. TaxID=2067044 RepID=UPI003A87DC9C